MRQTVRVDYCFLIWHSHNSLCLCDCASSMIPILSFCFYFAVRLRRHYFSLLREKNSPQGTFHPKRSFIQREVSPQGKFYPEGRFTPREVSPQGTFHPQRPFTSKKNLQIYLACVYFFCTTYFRLPCCETSLEVKYHRLWESLFTFLSRIPVVLSSERFVSLSRSLENAKHRSSLTHRTSNWCLADEQQECGRPVQHHHADNVSRQQVERVARRATKSFSVNCRLKRQRLISAGEKKKKNELTII